MHCVCLRLSLAFLGSQGLFISHTLTIAVAAVAVAVTVAVTAAAAVTSIAVT